MKTFLIHDKELGNTYAIVAEDQATAIGKYERFWQMDDNDPPELKEEWLNTLQIECIDHDCEVVVRMF